jgi:hypothetical protein
VQATIPPTADFSRKAAVELNLIRRISHVNIVTN